MAKKSHRADRPSPYQVSFIHPVSGKRTKKCFKTQAAQEDAFRYYDRIEYLQRTNQEWRREWYNEDVAATIGDVFALFRTDYLSDINNDDTVRKYESTLKSVTAIFPESTPVEMIRGLERHMAVGLRKGWGIYKAHREAMGRTRRGINSYLSEIHTAFQYALENGGKDNNGLITLNPIKKGRMGDKFKKSELEPLDVFEWTNANIKRLFNNEAMPKYHRELVMVYSLIGVRATELAGYNYKDRNKELKWHHVDLKKGEIMLWVGKQGSAARRKRAPLHPEVVKIFTKWRDVDNLERPIPHAYRWIWNTMKEVKQITGLNFTNHDLRRLKAQLTEKKTHDAKAAAYSIGDKSVEMVKSHYAPTSMSTLRHFNEEAFSQLTTELECSA